jgi:hypothetical protein
MKDYNMPDIASLTLEFMGREIASTSTDCTNWNMCIQKAKEKEIDKPS